MGFNRGGKRHSKYGWYKTLHLGARTELKSESWAPLFSFSCFLVHPDGKQTASCFCCNCFNMLLPAQPWRTDSPGPNKLLLLSCFLSGTSSKQEKSKLCIVWLVEIFLAIPQWDVLVTKIFKRNILKERIYFGIWFQSFSQCLLGPIIVNGRHDGTTWWEGRSRAEFLLSGWLQSRKRYAEARDEM